MKNHVILVDNTDRPIGSEEKIKAHRSGLLHRAFSIFIFNNSGLLLLQKRNPQKYHCGNLWSNTCCSHPRFNESLEGAAHRRLMEEMGFDCKLKYLKRFYYKCKFRNGLTENEIDHVYYGIYDGELVPNPVEISEVRWIDLDDLKEDIKTNDNQYTPWLKPALSIILESPNVYIS